jgi:phage terminase large subunit-like protein
VTVLLPDAADLAALGMFERRLEAAPEDPRTEWRRIARPEQLLPPLDDPWRVFLLTGGRGSGKSRSGAQGLVEIILSDGEPEGQFGICAPTYRDAWTVDVEGEALALDTYVPTPTGSTTMGEIRPGDAVLGGDGSPCRVTAAYEALTGRDCYRVTFKGGASVIADGDHKWLVEDWLGRLSNKRKANRTVPRRPGPKGEVIPPFVVTTAGMIPTVMHEGAALRVRNYGVRVAKATYADMPAALLIDPYVLGYWLGDGTAKSSDITTADPEVLDHFRQAGHGIVQRPDYGYQGRAHTYGVSELQRHLRRSNLLRNKHVPAEYLRASAADRLALVQGLMDSDGSVSERGQCEFSNKNQLLADALVELLCSLGIKASAPRPKLSRVGTTHWLVKFTTTQPVFRISRKLARVPGAYRDADYWVIDSIEPVESVPVRCISVDSPDRTYLVTRHHIATHNSGVLRALGTTPGEVKHGTSRLVEYAHRSYGEIGLRNGHIIYVDSADDGALRIQGKNLRAIWADELGLWQRWQVAWDESIRYAVRKGASKIIATGTPKVSRPARALLRRLLRGEEPGVIVRRLRTADNAANLSEAFYQSVIGAAKGTRLERQELEGELLDDVANALWTRDLLEHIQVPAVGAEGGIPYLHGAVIGVDPSDGNEDSDEQAYTIAGKGAPDDRHLYVVESFGAQMAPAAFARKVILKAVEWNARIAVERNHGGAWLTATFHQVMKELDAAGRLPDGRKPRVETIWASQAKRTRAEPVSALYERDVVRHAGGPFVELEDQQCSFTGGQGERSPDRLDSLVFALHPFLNASFGPLGQSGVRKWAGAQELADMGVTEETKAHRRMREIAGKAAEGLEDAPWDLDGFSPQDEQEARPNRGNVRSWR